MKMSQVMKWYECENYDKISNTIIHQQCDVNVIIIVVVTVVVFNLQEYS